MPIIYLNKNLSLLDGHKLVKSGKITYHDTNENTVEVLFTNDTRSHYDISIVKWVTSRNAFVVKMKDLKSESVPTAKMEQPPKMAYNEDRPAPKKTLPSPKPGEKSAYEDLDDHVDVLTDKDVVVEQGLSINEESDLRFDTFFVLAKLNKDLKNASRVLGPLEARFLVDNYYAIQRQRIRFASQATALGKSGEPHTVLPHFFEQFELMENEVKTALNNYSAGHPMGQWMRQITGIGPVMAAGYLAHLDITRAFTAGSFWRFCGLDPTAKWEKGQKRPWNAAVKRICWLAGESWNKTQNLESDFYGKLQQKRKQYEIPKNLNGEYSAKALEILESKNFSKDSDAYKWYSGCFTAEDFQQYYALEAAKRLTFLKNVERKSGQGLPMLPPGHIHARAKRYSVFIFISHLFETWYEFHNGVAPPAKFAEAHLQHTHFIAAPYPVPKRK